MHLLCHRNAGGREGILRRKSEQNSDEAQSIVKCDVSKGEGDVTALKKSAFIHCIYQRQPTE
ncbi:Hypothetical protein ABZS17G119_03822 [Kosakonia cowanii]